MFSSKSRSNPIADFLMSLFGLRVRHNPNSFGNPNTKEMYRVFHSNASSKSRVVDMPDTPTELFIIGRIPSIPYIPYGSSGKDQGAVYVHEFGDYGGGNKRSGKDVMPLLAADDKDNLYIVKDRATFRNESRGIVG